MPIGLNTDKWDEFKKIEKLAEEELNKDWEIRRKETENRQKETENKVSAKIDDSIIIEAEKMAKKISELYAIDDWIKLFNDISYDNEIAGRCIYHVLLGQCIADKKILLPNGTAIDNRIHFVWVSPSGSGKGQAFELAINVAEHLKIQCAFKNETNNEISYQTRPFRIYKYSKGSDASLIDEPVFKKGKIVQGQIKFGSLSQKDLLYMEEARPLLESGKFNEDLREIFLGIMEPVCNKNHGYSKKLKDWDTEIITKSRISLLCTTRPVNGLKENMIWNGMMPRTLFLVVNLSIDDRKHMSKNDNANSFETRNNSIKAVSDLETRIKAVAKKINEVAEFAYKTELDIKKEDVAILNTFLNNKMIEIWDDLSKFGNEITPQILEIFVTRYKALIIKLTNHSAYTRKSKYIELADLQYAFDLIKHCYTSQVKWVTEEVIEDYNEKEKFKKKKNIYDSILKIYSENKNISRKDLIDKSVFVTQKAESYIYGVIRILVKEKKIKFEEK